MSAHVHIDFETKSVADLPKVGIHNYATHPSTDAHCMAWAIGDEPVRILRTGLLARSVRTHVEAGRLVVAHNAQFEFMIWNHVMVPRYGWPELKLEQMRCTMAAAYSMSLPGALDNLAVALGLEYRKDQEGYRIMLQLSRPRSEDPLVWWDDFEKTERLFAYCCTDVEVERAAHKHLVSLSDSEEQLWRLDQRINMRGIHFDRAAVVAAKAMADAEKARLDREMQALTGNYVGTCQSHAALAEWIQLHGVKIDGVAKPEVLDALAGDLPAAVRAALLLRQEAAKSSTAKLKSMLAAASADDRIRFMFQYHGAGTGRWSGRRVQLHNMPRPTMEQGDIESSIALVTAGKRDEIDMMYGTPLNVIASCLRGMLDAAPGKDLMAADFANIEGRVLAWLAGEEWKLQAFRDYDAGTGPDIYKLTYARSFNVPVESVTKDDRQVGKVEELAFGYQGWVGACQTMAKTLNVKVDDNDAEQWARAWRAAHPATRAYWAELEAAAVDAVRNPGSICRVGPVGRQVAFRRVESFLYLQLPSGRVLCYPYPAVILKTRVFDDGKSVTKDAVTYVGEDSVTRKWGPIDTYGGKWAENITQAVARDILSEAMTRVAAIGACIVLHVHDEVVIEIPGTNPLNAQDFGQIVAESPAWAAGLPIAAAGWRGKRYRK